MTSSQIITLICLFILLTGCEQTDNETFSQENTNTRSDGSERWYSDEQVIKGLSLYAENCVGCHGEKARATPKWRTINADGHYPPPPLNGTAHAWHHPMKVLRKTIKEGSARVGGQMPGFGNKLSSHEIDAVIASFQAYWPNKLYSAWEDRNQ